MGNIYFYFKKLIIIPLENHLLGLSIEHFLSLATDPRSKNLAYTELYSKNDLTNLNFISYSVELHADLV